jgi:hypothetical protein
MILEQITTSAYSTLLVNNDYPENLTFIRKNEWKVVEICKDLQLDFHDYEKENEILFFQSTTLSINLRLIHPKLSNT